jgi:hypothetical protein
MSISGKLQLCPAREVYDDGLDLGRHGCKGVKT